MTEHIEEIRLSRHILDSDHLFSDVLASIYSGIGQPNFAQLFESLAATSSFEDYVRIVDEAAGSAGLIRFLHLDLGDAVRRATSGVVGRRLVRIIAGNPVTMASMTQYVGHAGSYAPVSILVEELPSGCRASYDSVASALAIYPEAVDALPTARALDDEVLTLLRAATG